jgi:hypothetical protein
MMCGGSSFIMKGKDCSVYLGYYGGRVSVGNREITDEGQKDLRMMFRGWSRDDLLEFLKEMVINGDE